ncbi:hypothetical protein FRB99_003260 [Tulasnella sp. 403]|nr:hypothetical protein FRB99_003260 [Tulasnella sp. 403]
MAGQAPDPKVMSVHLTSVSMDWQTHPFSGLQTLRLSHVDPGPTLKRLIDIIENSPTLQNLSISNFHVAHETPRLEHRYAPFTPRMLDDPDLFGISPEVAYEILSCVSINERSALCLDVTELASNSDEASAIMTFAFRYIKSLALSHITVHIGGSDYTLGDRFENWSIVLSCAEGEVTEDFVHVVNEHLIKNVPGLHNCAIKLGINMRTADPLSIMNVMSSVFHITELIMVPSQMSDLEPLARSLPSGNWLFSDLRELAVDVYGVEVDEILPAVVQARWITSWLTKYKDTKSDVSPIKRVFVGGDGTITQDAYAWLATTQLIELFEIEPNIALEA